MNDVKRIRVAIIGTGNIGTDLCYRMLRDPRFEVVALVGRRADSPGIQMFSGQLKHLISNGIEGLIPFLDEIDGAFDATSAFDHKEHWDRLAASRKWMMDLTPSKIGRPIVPALIGENASMKLGERFPFNYSLVTCGGQSSAALLHAISKYSTGIKEVEISSSIASLSAGPATRRNIDQYIESTENLANLITGCSSTKAILVLNPADPPVMMRTTVSMRVEKADLSRMDFELRSVVEEIKRYVPGYEIVVAPHLSKDGVVSATAKVTGAGYFLPSYAGNLDIINAAGVEVAKRHFNIHRQKSETK
jgi:acetaldehyde dehydrogenase